MGPALSSTKRLHNQTAIRVFQFVKSMSDLLQTTDLAVTTTNSPLAFERVGPDTNPGWDRYLVLEGRRAFPHREHLRHVRVLLPALVRARPRRSRRRSAGSCGAAYEPRRRVDRHGESCAP